MPTQLVVISGPDKGRVFPVGAGVPLVIGRGQTSHTKLVDPHASRNHCEVRLEGTRVLLTDSGSVGGTFVNGQRITTQELRAGDVVHVGETDLRFESGVAEDQTLPPTAAPVWPGAGERQVLPATAVKGVVPTAVKASPATPVTAPPPPAPAIAAPPPAPAREMVFAQKAGVRAMPKPLQQLHDLVGQALGSYQILKVIGTGTVGLVFQARDTRDQKIVALKVLKPDFAKDSKAHQRFIRGIKTACTLNHPNLVALLNAGITDNRCWIAMEYVEGESLAQTMKSGKMEWPRALKVAMHVAKALGYIHDLGVIHRNVMPQNILLGRAAAGETDQPVKLGDVMLAKALEGNQAAEVTASGELVGNIYYLAPERTREKDEVDGRADLYSLGATVYALLTGQLPFMGASLVDVITKIRMLNPDKPRKFQPAIPDLFESIVMKLLAKRPDDRFQTAAELLTELAKVQPIKK